MSNIKHIIIILQLCLCHRLAATISHPISLNINADNTADTRAAAQARGDATHAAANGVPFAPEEVPPNDPGGFELAFGELEGAVLPPPVPTGGTCRGHLCGQCKEQIVVLGGRGGCSGTGGRSRPGSHSSSHGCGSGHDCGSGHGDHGQG